MKNTRFIPEYFTRKMICFLICFSTCQLTGLQLSNLYAQQKWTLQQCIDYAKENNISLKQSSINTENAAIDIIGSKGALFPSLSFGINQNYTGRYLLEENTSQKNSYTGSYGLSANWNVYKGGQQRTNIKQKEVNKEISDQETARLEEDLEVSITQYYIQILYAIEAVKINEQTVEASEQQTERARTLLTAGSISKSDLAQLEAQLSSDKYNLVTAQSTLAQYKLNLKQLLELEPEATIEIAEPKIEEYRILTTLPEKMEVFNTSMAIRPDIKISQLNQQAAELNLKSAKGGYLPTVSITASSGTNNASGSNYSFGKQIKNSWNNTAGVNITIPVFSNRTNSTNVQKAKNEIENYKLDYTNTQKDLYQTIENLWLDAKNAQEKYLSAKEQFASAIISYDLINEQFNLGMKNTVELIQEKTNYLSAQQSMIQSKYMALFSIQILEFYNGKNISL